MIAMTVQVQVFAVEVGTPSAVGFGSFVDVLLVITTSWYSDPAFSLQVTETW